MRSTPSKLQPGATEEGMTAARLREPRPRMVRCAGRLVFIDRASRGVPTSKPARLRPLPDRPGTTRKRAGCSLQRNDLGRGARPGPFAFPQRLLPDLGRGRLTAPPSRGEASPVAEPRTTRLIQTATGRASPDESGAGTAFPARSVVVSTRTTQHRPALEERAKPTTGTVTG